MDNLNETTDTTTGAPAAEPVAETVATETTTPDVAAPAAEPEASASEPEAGQPETAPVADVAVVLPEEVQAQLSELSSEREAWGPHWEIRDLARKAMGAFLTEDADVTLEALAEASGPRAYQLVHNILEANAAKHVADAHGISSRELERRLGTPEEIQLSRAVERAMDAMPDEQAEEVRAVYAQNATLRKQLADAQGIAKEARGQIESFSEQTAVNQFVSDFATWQGQVLSELVESVPDAARNSVLTVTRENFRHDPTAAKAVAAYSNAIMRGENPRVVNATYLPPVLEALRNVMRDELVTVRGFTPRVAAQPAPAKAPVASPTKPAAKLIGVTPGKGAAPAAATTPATPTARPAESHRDAALRIAADIAETRAARREGAQAATK